MTTYTISYNQIEVYWYSTQDGTWASSTYSVPGPVIGPFSQPNSGGPENTVWDDYVGDGDVATGVVSGGVFDVENAGIVDRLTVAGGAIVNVESGGSAFGVVIDPGGTLSALNPDTVVDVVGGTIADSGSCYMDGSGQVSDVLVSSGGLLFGDNCTVSSATVEDGGKIQINSGGGSDPGELGAASAVDVGNGGTLEVNGGDVAATDVSVHSGGLLVDAGDASEIDLYDGGSADLEDFGVEGVASDVTVEAAGEVYIYGGGSVEGTITFASNDSILWMSNVYVSSEVIYGFASGDTIDLASLLYASGEAATLQSGGLLEITEGGQTYDLQFDPKQAFARGFELNSDGSGGTDVRLGSAALFTSGPDRVNFNELTSAQDAAVAGGADTYNGLGGNDVVTLPSVANYSESVGSGKTLRWTNTSELTFHTDSRPGDTYTISGTDGDYFIDEGEGTEFITITGGGSSTIDAGGGNDTIKITGNGDNTVKAGSGPEEIAFTGSGVDTFTGGDGDYTISATSGSLDITGALTETGSGSVTIRDFETLDAEGAFSGDLGLPYGGKFYIDAPDGFTIAPDVSTTVIPEISIGLAGEEAVLTLEDATASYSHTALTLSGTVLAALGGVSAPLFKGSFTLPYKNATTSSLTDSGPFKGRFTLAGLPITYENLTLQNDLLLASLALTLPFSNGTSLTLNPSNMGPDFGLLFGGSGPQLQPADTVNLASDGYINFFGFFVGVLSSATLSYDPSSGALKLQGQFAAGSFLNPFLTGDVDFSGDNYIEFQDGTPYFKGTLSLYNVTSTDGAALSPIKEIDLSIDTKAKTFSGEMKFTTPFGVTLPTADVKITGGWGAADPYVISVSVTFSGFNFPIPGTATFWNSAQLQVANFFTPTPSKPTTYSGTLGFGFGPKILGQYVGSLKVSVSNSSAQLSGSEALQIVPYSFVTGLTGAWFSKFKGLFPLFSDTGAITMNFAPDDGGFSDVTFSGDIGILGNFITTNETFVANANFDFAFAGSATINFADAGISKLVNLGVQSNANFLVSFTNGAPLSDDFVEAWGSATVSGVFGYSFVMTVLVRTTFDAGHVFVDVSLPTAIHSVSAAPLVAHASANAQPSVTPSSYLFITVSWTNAATAPITLQVTGPKIRSSPPRTSPPTASPRSPRLRPPTQRP